MGAPHRTAAARTPGATRFPEGRSRLASRTKDEATFHLGFQLAPRDPDVPDAVLRAGDLHHVGVRGEKAGVSVRAGLIRAPGIRDREPFLAAAHGAAVDDEQVASGREVPAAYCLV